MVQAGVPDPPSSLLILLWEASTAREPPGESPCGHPVNRLLNFVPLNDPLYCLINDTINGPMSGHLKVSRHEKPSERLNYSEAIHMAIQWPFE